MGVDGHRPLGDDEFADLMASLGPFERHPQLAVAVSGGADSLALLLLAARWAAGRGGTVVGLTVDHGLRPEAAGEAEQVGRWLAARGVSHHILRWSGTKPTTGLQAAAREARYALLRRWCRAAGVLHLLLAHHLDDQAETLLMRLARGSGVDGLAAMARVAETAEVRLLRPLLAVPRTRLAASLEAIGQPWIEDPSNRSERFGRSRLRRLMPELSSEGMDAGRLAATAHRLGRARQALEQATTDLVVRCVVLHAAGFARFDARRMAEAPEEISLRLVARLCRTIGGSVYPPRLERLERVHAELRGGLKVRRTFAGCVLAPTAAGVLVCREPDAVAGPLPLDAGGVVLWDGRYSVSYSGEGPAQVAALGRRGWQAIRDAVDRPALPEAVRITVPAIVDRHGICAVPHLGYKRPVPAVPIAEQIAFTPAFPLAGARHCLV